MIPFLTGPYGDKNAITHNLDRLAEQGVVFNAAYTPNPICAPARACIMTGKYSSNIRVWDNASPLHSDEPTICHYLSREGYESVLSGKMHFIGPDQMHGYDKRLIPSIYPCNFAWTKARFNKQPGTHAEGYRGDGIQIMSEGTDLKKDKSGNFSFMQPVYDFWKEHTVISGFNKISHNSQFDKWAHFKALDYLNEQKAKCDNGEKQPFFLTVSYNFPHEPFSPPQELFDLYKNTNIELPFLKDSLNEWYSPMDKWLNRHHGLNTIDVTDQESMKKVRRAYYALITYIDIMVGELMKGLEETGFDKNTIVIFTSDHGDMLLEKGMVQKRSFYEWSSRVPLIIKYPDQKFAKKKIAEPVSLIDILPTILDMAGVPDSIRINIDGKSLVPLIDGTDVKKRYVISEMHSEGVYAPCFMVRFGDYKYNYFHGYGSQLFNLVDDPEEWDNLSGSISTMKEENQLRSIIFKHFNPEQIDKQVTESIKKRMIIQPILEEQKINWNYYPEPPAGKAIRTQ
jgi:choline-sulfatase